MLIWTSDSTVMECLSSDGCWWWISSSVYHPDQASRDSEGDHGKPQGPAEESTRGHEEDGQGCIWKDTYKLPNLTCLVKFMKKKVVSSLPFAWLLVLNDFNIGLKDSRTIELEGYISRNDADYSLTRQHTCISSVLYLRISLSAEKARITQEGGCSSRGEVSGKTRALAAKQAKKYG